MPERARVKPETFGHLSSVGEVIEMQREISRATTENEILLPFLQRFSTLAGATHGLSLLTEGLEPGSYRPMGIFDLDPSQMSLAWLESSSRWKLPFEDTPAVRSSVISPMIETGAPCLVRGVAADDDAVLHDLYPGDRDLLGIPVYDAGSIREWVFILGHAGVVIEEERLRSGIGNFNMMIQGLKHMRTSLELKEMHAKLDAQMSEIGRVQRSLLPSSGPDDPRISVVTSYQPCEAAGGDYFDHRRFPNPAGGDDLVGLIIADVSGHGPVASVTMAVFRTAMAATARYTTEPKQTVPDVNAMLYESVEPGTFVTAFLVLIDPASGRGTFVSCGHNPPRLRRASCVIETLDGDGGPPLGILPTMEPFGEPFTMSPGDLLVLYTDGITEAFSPEDELFGTERLDAAIALGEGDPERTRRAILAAVDAHAAGRPRDDDQTLLVMRYNGPGG
ncbi:MAG: PP2C family protein-serine/threonine phosphatase [Planctomycetota bacterium]